MSSASEDWYEDDAFWIDSYPFMFPPESFETARGQVDRIVELTGLREGSVLDLACGPGRHAVPCAKRGFNVTAVDRTPFLLEEARRYAEREGARVDFLEQDMRAPVPGGPFDLAVCLFTSFGLFDDDRDNREVLSNAHRSLRPGGAFVVDVLGKELVAQRYTPTSSRALDDGRVLVQHREIIEGWSRVQTEWMIVDGERARSLRFRCWLYSGRELRLLLQDAGFEEVALYGDLEGTPYGPDARRLVAVGVRG